MTVRSRLLWSALAVVFIAGGVAIGTGIVGSPSETELNRLDDLRMRNLQSLSLAVDLFFQRHDRLPTTLDECRREAGPGLALDDPASRRPYAYAVKDARHYEVCADFARASDAHADGGVSADWTHGAGRWCLERSLPDRRQ